MDVRIGVTHSPREISLELADETDREKLQHEIDAALADKDRVLWLSDKRGRLVGVPAERIAYVEISNPEDERRIGFGG